MDEALSETETRTIASAPVSDRSIIGKTAKTLCKGTDIYWTYSICENNSTGKCIDLNQANKLVPG